MARCALKKASFALSQRAYFGPMALTQNSGLLALGLIFRMEIMLE
jgi:hypothetical protein